MRSTVPSTIDDNVKSSQRSLNSNDKSNVALHPSPIATNDQHPEKFKKGPHISESPIRWVGKEWFRVTSSWHRSRTPTTSRATVSSSSLETISDAKHQGKNSTYLSISLTSAKILAHEYGSNALLLQVVCTFDVNDQSTNGQAPPSC